MAATELMLRFLLLLSVPGLAKAELEVEGSTLRAEVEGSTLRAEVEGSTLRAEVEGSTLRAEGESSTLRAEVEGSTLRAEVEGSTLRAEVEGSTLRAEGESSTLRAEVEGSTLRAEVEGSTLKAEDESSTLRAEVEGSTLRAEVEGSTLRAEVEGSTLRAEGESSTLRAEVEGSTLRAEVEGSTLRAEVEGSTLRAEGESSTLRAEVEGSTLRAEVEGSTLKAEDESSTLRAEVEGSTLRAEVEGSTLRAEVEGSTLRAEGESSTLKAEGENSTLKAEEVPMEETSPSETPEVQREETPGSSAGSVCPCDLHPGFCDLNCCCDLSCGLECKLESPECPFSFCLSGSTRAVSQVCLEKSLIFRNNTPYHTQILHSPDGCVLLFCVQLNDSKLNYLEEPQLVTKENFPALSAQYGGSSFVLPKQIQSSPVSFYQVGDPIQTFFAASSMLSVLKQPMGLGVSQLCIDENPAGFLESKSTSCMRIFTDLMSSCTTDPALDAASYYRDFTVLKVPVSTTVFQPVQVNITALSEPASPSWNGSTCHNVVSEVTYEVQFNGIHGIQNVSVQFKVANISGNPGSTLQQHFSLHFWSRSSSSTKQRSGNPGYITGAPLIALYNGTQQYITILQNQGDGHCSATKRYKVRFGENVRTGCQLSVPFKLEEENCSNLQEMLYQAFQGGYSLGSLAITGNANPGHPGEWNSIIIKKCNMQDGHCMLPVSLEIQVIWAQVGLLSNPQAQVLGARYYYLCKPLKSLGVSMNMLSVTTAAAFTDVTKWPEPPRGQPRVNWKLPFDFFFPFKVAFSGAYHFFAFTLLARAGYSLGKGLNLGREDY